MGFQNYDVLDIPSRFERLQAAEQLAKAESEPKEEGFWGEIVLTRIWDPALCKDTQRRFYDLDMMSHIG